VTGTPYEVISPAPWEAWQGLRDSDSGAVVSQSLPWLQAMCQASALRDASRLYQLPTGRRVLVPMVRPLRVPTVLATAASWPWAWGVGGPLLDGGSLAPVEAAQVVADVAQLPALRVQIRCRHDMPTQWTTAAENAFAVSSHAIYVLDLDGGFGQVWQRRFTSSARQAVRKAERSGLEVRTGRTAGLLAEFYDLYEQSVVRWAEQQHEPLALTRWRTRRANSHRMLQVVADQFQDSFTIWVAYQAGEPVAAIIVLSLGSYAKYWRGAMNKELANPTRANNLLRYDMGESRPDSSLARFKAGFGAASQVAYEYRKERVPVSAVQDRLRRGVKRVVGFRDA
jgi:hypothetical protein